MPQRDILSWFWSPLCAVGSHGPRGPNAQICVSVFGASIVPDRPRLLVVLSNTNYTTELAATSGTLTICLLAEDQLHLLEPLGLQSGRDADKLAGLDVRLTPSGDPLFPGAAGHASCEVIGSHSLGDSTAFLCGVTERETADRQPLHWQAARTVVGEEFLRRWAEKSVREQEAARATMLWRP